MELSRARNSAHVGQDTSRPYLTGASSLPNERGQVVQPGDLRVQEGRSANPSDGNRPVIGQRRHHHSGLPPAGGPAGGQVDTVRVVERREVGRGLLSELRRQGGGERRPRTAV